MVETRSMSKSPAPESPPRKKVKKEESIEPSLHSKRGGQDEEDKKPSEEAKATATSRKAEQARPSSSHPDGDNVKAGQLPPESFDGFTHARQNGLLEKGHLYFVYRPKVELETVESLDDVARFQIILFPDPPQKGVTLHRMLAVGRKHLPEPSRHEVVWGAVTELGDDTDKLKEGLRAETYSTKTRGERHIGPTRLAGRGSYIVYSVNDAPKDSQNDSARFKTYLAYHLQLPQDLGPVQEELKIQSEGVLHLQVKNPSAPSTNPRVSNAPPERQPKYPHELKSLFKTRFIPANPVALLNYPGAELLFIPSKHKLSEVIGEDGAEQLEENDDRANDGIEIVKKELHAKKGELDLEPLSGHWD